jgi:Heavy metal associated domain 2
VPTDALTVVHALPGRVRLRVPARADDEGLAQAVSALDGVAGCTWTPRTRSLLVRYEPAVIDTATIAERVAAHTGVATPARDPERAPVPPFAELVPSLFARVNERLARATRGTVDLATGVPLALVAWAAIELLRGRTAPLAWSSALWYAHGLFRDYNLADPPWRTNGARPDSRP